MDVIGEMDGTNQHTITRDELVEVALYNNDIAMLKDAILSDTASALYRKMNPRRSASRKTGGARA
jgi:hypothetical protein